VLATEVVFEPRSEREGTSHTEPDLSVPLLLEGLMPGFDLSKGHPFLNRAWVKRAACLDHPELDWFSRTERMKNAVRAVCDRCDVRSECLTFAIENDELGIWAGLDQRERRQVKREVA
jgi:Transcription factor WhiB